MIESNPTEHAVVTPFRNWLREGAKRKKDGFDRAKLFAWARELGSTLTHNAKQKEYIDYIQTQ